MRRRNSCVASKFAVGVLQDVLQCMLQWCYSAISFAVCVSVSVAVGVLQCVLQRCCRHINPYICICVWRKGGKDKRGRGLVPERESTRARERCAAGVLQSVLQWVLRWCWQCIFFAVGVLPCVVQCVVQCAVPCVVQWVCCSVCCSVCRVQCVQCVVGGERVERERDE